jgi:general secretion pathway protein I
MYRWLQDYPTMSFDRNNEGYTLIEVLVAMTILAMSLTVLFRIFSTGLLNIDVSAQYAKAVVVAETQLAAAGLENELRPGQTEGAVDEQFYWLQTVEPYVQPDQSVDQDLPVSAFLVTVQVEWEHRGRTRQIRLNSIRLAADGGGAS